MSAKPISERTAYAAFQVPAPHRPSAYVLKSGAKIAIECTPRNTSKPTTSTATAPPFYFLLRALRLALLAGRFFAGFVFLPAAVRVFFAGGRFFAATDFFAG